MAHPGRCDRPSWIGFGGRSKRRNFLTMDGPDLREQVVVGEWSLGVADPGVDPCRNAQAEIGAAVPIDACGSTPAAGPLRYLKAPSFWYSPSMPAASWAFPGGRTWCVWYRRQAHCQILGLCDDGARPASGGSNP